MKFNINLTRSWVPLSTNQNVSYIGHITNLDQQINSLIEINQDRNEWINYLKKLNGFYSLVKYDKDTLYAAVDHIRSYPLFYGEKNDSIFLSDSAEWIRSQLEDLTMDESSVAEFQLTGYVTGNNTLYKRVKQLQAGECLIYENNRLILTRYYELDHKEPTGINEDSLLEMLDKVALISIENLLDYAKGRQIVLPLSGGYDSRLIATLLSQKQYSNIITYTYGDKDHIDTQYSKIVADSLNLRWYFIEYTDSLWKEFWCSEERKIYQKKASNWTSLPVMQDWLAVKKMTDMGLIDKNAVFVPGHTGDFISGGHIPKFLFENKHKTFNLDDVVEKIYDKHYRLTPIKRVNLSKTQALSKIKLSLHNECIRDYKDFANTYERWEWQERQAKFICNSTQVYSFFNYDWWLPLWDKNFVGFFEDLPIKYRNHTWYKDYVQSKYHSFTDYTECNKVGEIKGDSLANKISRLKLIKKTFIYNSLRQVYRSYFRREGKSLFIGESGYNEKKRYALQKKGYLANGRMAYFFLDEYRDNVRK